MPEHTPKPQQNPVTPEPAPETPPEPEYRPPEPAPETPPEPSAPEVDHGDNGDLIPDHHIDDGAGEI